MTLFGIIIAFVVVCNLLNWTEISDIGCFVVYSTLMTFAAALGLFVVFGGLAVVLSLIGTPCPWLGFSEFAAPAIGMIYTYDQMTKNDLAKPASRIGCLAAGMVVYGLFLWVIIYANTR